MSRTLGFIPVTVAVMAYAFTVSSFAMPQESHSDQLLRHPRIAGRIDPANLVTLPGNTRPEAIAKNDRGPISGSTYIEHMLLLLRRSPEQEQALQEFTSSVTDHSSPNFHQWITPAEFGDRYGVAQQDLNEITGWLESSGFSVNLVYDSGMMIDFSGYASSVRDIFHAELHRLNVRGAEHVANIHDPKIPAVLAPVIQGIVSLNDFMPRPMYLPRANFTFTNTQGTWHAIVPGDLATIYSLNPLFAQGLSGQGQTIVVIEDTNISNSGADWTTFRNEFGLNVFGSGSFSQVHPAPPSGHTNCSSPGVNSDEGEASLDAEYASAAAPSAAIELASCKNTLFTFGGLIALQNIINSSATPPAIISISYGECEAANGATSNAAYNAAYQQATTEGVSVFVSSGDEGAASCDAGANGATHGIGVSAFASTPNNVAVGGTDFSDSYSGTVSTYWKSSNSSNFGSAMSYIPEIPWNDSCASVLLSTFVSGSPTTYGSSGFCNSSAGTANFLTTTSGSGGPSGCATGLALPGGVVSGTCAGYAKPSWQIGLFGNPSDGVRDIPDVSLFAANGVWSHYYVFCWSNPAFTSSGSASCSGTPDTWSGAGGTSFSSPIMAAIQALVNQKWGRQGNPNPTYYAIAAAEFGSSGTTACNSSTMPVFPRNIATACVFYDVTLGDIDVNCTGTNNCYLPSGTNGVLSTSNSSYQPAYPAASGWDFATGIGTVNAYNLVFDSHWTIGP